LDLRVSRDLKIAKGNTPSAHDDARAVAPNAAPVTTPVTKPVLSGKSIEPSRGAMIVAEKPAEPRAAMDVAIRTRWSETLRRNEPIVNTLVIPFPVVVCHERGERPAQVGFPEDDDPIQAFLLDQPDESLRVRASRLQLDDKQRVVRDQAADRPHLGREEIRSSDRGQCAARNVR